MDAWLLRRFPGRTLDELDSMDYPRYLRALEAEKLEAVEEKRNLFVSDRIKPEDITPDEWEIIRENDELINGG